MNKILHPFSQQLSWRSTNFYPVFISITTERGYLSITGVQNPYSSGNCMGSCGQIDTGYWHRDAAQNDKRRFMPATKPEELRFSQDWSADLWLDLLDVWHTYHLKKVEDVPNNILEWLRALPNSKRSPHWV